MTETLTEVEIEMAKRRIAFLLDKEQKVLNELNIKYYDCELLRSSLQTRNEMRKRLKVITRLHRIQQKLERL